ncbi:MAG: ATP synthase F0 subunit B [Pseudomonadota bacterium]
MTVFSRNTRKTVFFFVLFAAALALCLQGTAMAAETTSGKGHGAAQESVKDGAPEGGHGKVDRTGDLLDLLYRFINFALLVIILGWGFKKAGVKDFLAARIDEIRKKMDDLKREKKSSEETYQELDKKLKAFEEEKRQLLEGYRKEGEAEKERIIAEANLRVKQIIEQAELTIQQEMQSAKNRLKMEIVELAAQKAREIISETISEKDRDLLADDFIERVGKIH